VHSIDHQIRVHQGRTPENYTSFTSPRANGFTVMSKNQKRGMRNDMLFEEEKKICLEILLLDNLNEKQK
jgi:hypothetical protein